jgi:hypothetical protein
MQVTSTLGITDRDIEVARDQGIHVESAYQFLLCSKSK